MRACKSCLIVAALAVVALSGCRELAGPMAPADSRPADDPDQLTHLLPAPAQLEAATLHLYVTDVSQHVVTLHRITADWSESEVTWFNFAGGYDPEPAAFFYVEHGGWFAIDMTAQVQAWMAGDAENFGFLLKHEPLAAPRTICPSREAGADEPYLEIRYATGQGEIIENHAPLADSFIWQAMPSLNFGANALLYIGWPNAQLGTEMQSLIRFETPVPPDDPGDDPGCTRSLAYWMTHAGPESANHPDAVTPLLPLWLGEAGGEHSLLVDQAETARSVLAVTTTGGRDNGIIMLQAALLAAKLNVAGGADGADIAQTWAAADAFLAQHGIKAWAELSKPEQVQVMAWSENCEAYNNGEIGPGSCTATQSPTKP